MSRIAVALAATIFFTAGSAVADPSPQSSAPSTSSKQDVSTLLFANPDWQKAPAGSTITYSYTRKVTKPEFGASFDDHVKITLEKGDKPAERTVDMVFLTGEHRRPAGPFSSDSQNPVLLIVLEDNVQELAKLFHANPRFLKNTIRKAWREKPTIEDAKFDWNGKTIQGTRIIVTPFVGSDEEDRMKGLDEMAYEVDISDEIPGEIYEINIHAPQKGAATFSEVLKYESIKNP